MQRSYSPASMVPMKFNKTLNCGDPTIVSEFPSPHELGNVQAIPAIAHGLFISSTRCNSNPTMASCMTHHKAEVTSEFPMPRLRDVEMTALKRMNKNPRPTFTHVRRVDSSAEGLTIEASWWYCNPWEYKAFTNTSTLFLRTCRATIVGREILQLVG